jgi:hypothetical protein
VKRGLWVVGKTASSMRTNPSLGGCNILWRSTSESQGGFPEGPNKLRCKNSAPRTKGNILSKEVTRGLKPPGGNKEEPNFPLIPKGMIKAPLEHVKKNLRRRSDPQGATRASRFFPSGRPAPREGAGLKSLRSLPPCG